MSADVRLLEPAELEAIAKRVAREPVYSSYADCSQAVADRRHLLGHLMALQAAGMRALDAIDVDDQLDLDAARRLARIRQDRDAEEPAI